MHIQKLLTKCIKNKKPMYTAEKNQQQLIIVLLTSGSGRNILCLLAQ